MINDMKDSLRAILVGDTMSDILTRKLEQKYDDVRVMYGETKKTRSQPVGVLVLGQRKDVVRMVRDREYGSL